MGLYPLSPQEAGRRIRDARHARGLRQWELARDVGVAQSLVSHWETGRTPVSREYLPPLANALRIPVADLLVDDGRRRPRRARKAKEGVVPATGVDQRVAG